MEIDSEMGRKVGKYRDLEDGNSASSRSRRGRSNASEVLHGHAGHHDGRDSHSRRAFRSKATKLLVKLREEGKMAEYYFYFGTEIFGATVTLRLE